MALSGLDIYKLLPKTNCRQCGFPTCLAFALSLAKKAVVLTKCPFVSEQAKAALEAQSQPPIKLITLGDDANKVEVGNETVLFRHEEKFHHPCAIGFIIEDSLSNQEITLRLEKIKQFHFERVGQLIKTDLIAIKQTQTGERFIEVLKLVLGANQPLALITNDKTALEGALKILAGKKPLIYAADSENLSGFSSLAKEHNASLALKAPSIDSLPDLAARVKESGVSDILIALNTNNKPAQTIWELTQIRRQALKKN
ncbi:MAG: (Fe-S)-binding protein, partial [Candidatus Omnitrophota bacterium]